jgi:hypothetical protein
MKSNAITAGIGKAPRPTFSNPNASVASPMPVSAKTAEVEGAAARLLQVADQQVDQNDPQNADRDVDEENPAPRGVSDDKAAERRPHNGPDQRWDADIGHRSDQVGFWYRAQQNEAPDRDHQRAAHALNDAGHDESRKRIGAPATDRAQGEDGDSAAEHPARTKPIGGPPADRDEHGEAQEITGDRHIEAQRALVE